MPIPTSSAQTNQQQIAELDENFSASLGEFDEMLLSEQERIAQHVPKNRGNSFRPSLFIYYFGAFIW